MRSYTIEAASNLDYPGANFWTADISDKKFAKEFKKIDADGSGEICLNELLTWWRKQKAKAR